MCAPDGQHARGGRPSPSDFVANLRQPGPLGWKLQRVVVNTAIKIVRRQQCCGNGGEPGC